MNRLVQSGAAALLALLILAALAQIVLGIGRGPGFLAFSGMLTLAFVPFILLLLATPPVTVSREGITIGHPWKAEQLIPWEMVRALKDYPLLPAQEMEAGRRALVGRRKYRPAEGKMLVIPALPLPYRFAGLFAGEGFTGVIALTNRTHTDYERLVEQVARHLASQTE